MLAFIMSLRPFLASSHIRLMLGPSQFVCTCSHSSEAVSYPHPVSQSGGGLSKYGKRRGLRLHTRLQKEKKELKRCSRSFSFLVCKSVFFPVGPGTRTILTQTQSYISITGPSDEG